jgi:hypothetical protein
MAESGEQREESQKREWSAHCRENTR